MKLLVSSKKEAIVFVALEKIIYCIRLSTESTPSHVIQEYKLPTEVAAAVILAVELDENEEFLVAVWSNKTISCWNVKDGIFQGSKQMKKKAGTLVISTWKENRRVAMVGDRGGDIWGFNLPQLSKEVLLGGHTSSVITDTAYSQINNLVITVDRDEKIRYSSFPDLEVIGGYSLGHTGVVSSVSVINNRYLASIGWDHNLFIWDLQTFAKADEQVLHSISTLEKEDPESGDEEDVEEQEGQNEDEMVVDGEVTKAEGEEQAGDGVEGEGEGEDGEKDKNYDESSFGNYPFKVASLTDTTTGSFSTAVIFKDELSFQLLHYSSTASFHSTQDIPLPAVPIDILAFQLNHVWYWLVILPLPFLFEVCAQRDQVNIERVTSQFFSSDLIQSLSSSSSLNLSNEFHQGHYISLLGYNNETGMRKHSLENYYGNQDELNPSNSRRVRRKMWKRHYFRSLHFGNK